MAKKEKESRAFHSPARQQKSSPSPSASAGAKGEIVAWRSFPQLEKILKSEDFQPVLQKVEKTCRELDRIVHSGPRDEKARAQAAMTAYGRTLELLRQLTELKDKMAN